MSLDPKLRDKLKKIVRSGRLDELYHKVLDNHTKRIREEVQMNRFSNDAAGIAQQKPFTPDLHEEKEERAAIFECELGLSRGHANTLAHWLVYKRVDPTNKNYEELRERWIREGRIKTIETERKV